MEEDDLPPTPEVSEPPRPAFRRQPTLSLPTIEEEAAYRPPLGASPVLMFPAPDEPRPTVHLIDYGLEFCTEIREPGIDVFRQYLDRPSITWIDVHGLGDPDLLQEIGKSLDLHPLAVANIVNLPQRARVEHFEDHLAITARFVTRTSEALCQVRHVVIFLRPDLVATFVQGKEEVEIFEPIRQRLRNARTLIRRMGSDFLAYAILDVIVDSYYPVLEGLDERLEEVEQEIMRGTERDVLSEVHDLRRDILEMKRSMAQHRDAVGLLLREEHPVLGEGVRIYLRDVYEHAIHLSEMVETLREVGGTMRELHMNMNAHKLNDIMRVLTIISTIFIPMSFVAGVYGMNFHTDSPYNMPELTWRYGYLGFWFVIAIMAGGMLFGFGRAGWLGKWPRRKERDQER